VPDRFLVGVRLSPEDYGFARGIDLDDSIATAKALCDDGIDFLHLSLWDASKATKKRPEAHAVPLFRAAIAADVRILAAGSIWTRAEAEELAARGADMVALGRAAIANPDWPARATDPTWSPKRPPLTRAELRDRGLSDRFVDYMKRWKGFVDEA
jgi:2,4-dienoyl-CoA reductase-like NADH-dependent reductase (Old Yellow Enzyme family)